MRITLKVLAVTSVALAAGTPSAVMAKSHCAAGYKYYNHACHPVHSSAAPAQSPGYGGPVRGAVSGMQSGGQKGAASAGPVGAVVGSDVYDGLPSMDPTVCAGSTNFSGQRSENEEVEGSYFTVVPHPSYTAHRFGGEAQITSLAGSAFAGNFLKPLEFGETVRAREHLKTSLAGGNPVNGRALFHRFNTC